MTKPKPQHGGPRVPGEGKRLGRPAQNQKLRIIKIQCTPEELEQILAAIPDTRRRAEILLKAIEELTQ